MVMFDNNQLVNCPIAMENSHRNSGFSHRTWWIFPVGYGTVDQRVEMGKSYDNSAYIRGRTPKYGLEFI